jgi:hypothetical protein
MGIYDKLLSSRFGIRVAKIDEGFFEEMTVQESIEYFSKNKLDLIIARIDYSRLDLINKLEKIGFTTKDVQCTLRNTFKDRFGSYVFNKIERQDGYIIREFEQSDTEQIVHIARKSFLNYGHYAMNDRLDTKDSLEAYVDWSYNCCVNRDVATKIFVAEKDNEVAAYIAYKKMFDGNNAYAAGVIGAVSPNHRRQRLFPDLDIAALEWGIQEGFDWEEHNVLVDNVPVMKTHISVGFKPHSFMMTLHGWVDELDGGDDETQ